MLSDTTALTRDHSADRLTTAASRASPVVLCPTTMLSQRSRGARWRRLSSQSPRRSRRGRRTEAGTRRQLASSAAAGSGLAGPGWTVA